MKRGAVLIALVAIALAGAVELCSGCDDDAPAPADAASCSSLGCDGALLCNSGGECYCAGVRCDP